MIRLYAVLAVIVALAIALGGAFYKGKMDEREVWEVKMLNAEIEIRKLEKEAAVINEVVVTKYIDRIQYVDKVKIETVTEYVTIADDSACTINNGFVKVHDAAALSLPAKPALTDRLPSAVKLSQVSDAVNENYASCNKTRAQLESLQDWVRKQESNWNKQ